MRKYDKQREESRGLTVELCLVLALAVIGTIAFSAIAMSFLATGAAYEYLSYTTKIQMSDAYWRDVFFNRLVQCGVLTVVAVVGTGVYKSWQLADGGGRELARALGGTRLSEAGGDPELLKVLNVVDELAIAAG